VNLLGRVSVFPVVPARLERLSELAHNMWWSWNPEAQSLFSGMDPELWERIYHNPVKFLVEVDQARLDAAERDPQYLELYDRVMAAFDAYMTPKDTWYSRTFPQQAKATIAYFSAEFGLHEALPIYSGGLGILSGDHCKSASDLGLPFVGVGLLYNQGYFKQLLNAEGWQEASYKKLNFAELPIKPTQDANGNDIVISVELPGRTVFAKVWKVQVGRIPLYLLDTDIPDNAPEDRRFSAQLYGGDQDMRITQEILLGIGGVRALRQLGYSPEVWHMNEGHSAFLNLERCRELVQKQGLTFYEALEATAANSIFTTHTPVPAGNDAFTFDMMERYFHRFWGALGLNREEFMTLGRHEQPAGPPLFSLTVLALRLSRQANGVSKLHGEVSRRIWHDLWPGVPKPEVPITSITNGIHTETWLAPELGKLLNAYLGNQWHERVEEEATWKKLDAVPDAELWQVHRQLKHQMVDFLRERVKTQWLRHGESHAKLKEAETLLDPEALTLGFARRFATYKRATLIFRDAARLQKTLHDPNRPVQIIFAGKAHPADEPGKRFIQQIHQIAKQEGFDGKVIMIEDYDMNVARHLVAGVDVWLNNPRRPLEASGTSGQKAALNGILNFSILDGWWVEGYNGINGWSIGEEREYKSYDEQDAADALSFYTTLEEEVVPLFYDRDADGVPHGWVKRMKNAMETLAPAFSMQRMVQDYSRDLYIPAVKHGEEFAANGYKVARDVSEWKGKLRFNWHHIHLEATGPKDGKLAVGETVEVTAKIRLGHLKPSDVAVEITHGREVAGQLTDFETLPMERIDEMDGTLTYRGEFVPKSSGSYGYGVRIVPNDPRMINKHELALIRWA